MAARQGPGARRRARHDAALARRGAARVDRAAAPYMPERPRSCSPRSATSGPSSSRAGVRRGPRRRARVGELPPLFPKPPVIDSHTHLDHGPAPEDELVAAARAAGVRPILTIGMDSASCRAALAAAERYEEVYAAVGRHPNSADGLRRRRGRRAARARRAPALPRDRRDRPRLLPRPRAARRPGARVRGPDRARARDRQAARDPHPRRRRRHGRHARQARRRARGDHALLLDARPRSTSASSAAGGSPSRATSPTRRPAELAAAAERVPLDRLLVETDAPYLTPQAVRKQRNQPAYVVAHRALRRRAARHRVRRLEEAVDANAARLFGW